MKIAIYSHSIAPQIDGVCRRFTAILHELERTGHSTILFTFEDNPQDIPSSTVVVKVDHIIFPTYPNKKIARPTCATWYSVVSTLAKEKPDVIHVVSDGFSQMFALAGLWLGIPVVGSFHTDIIDLLSTHGAYFFQKWLVLFKEWLDARVLDSCATTSPSFQRKLLKQGVPCEHIMMTAVDVKTFSADKRNEQLRREMTFNDPDAFLCTYVGRISNEKRLDVMVDAIRELTGSSNAYLALVGDGPSAPFYGEAHGKENRLYCKPGFLSHSKLAEVYASSDVHVSSSEFETLGNTVLESFACEVPVVVPRTQGFQDTVRHEQDGFLFKPSNRQDATSCIQRLKDDSALRRKMGIAGRAAVEQRTIMYVVKDTLHWYEHSGMRNRRARSWLNKVLSLLALAASVPFTICMFFLYDILVNYLLKSMIQQGGYLATEPATLYKHGKKQQ